MSRSGYSDECEHIELYRASVHRATVGARGQHFLRKLLAALDAMPVKRLIVDAIRDEAGEVCALGALDPSVESYEAEDLARHFGIANALASEIVYENDEHNQYRFEYQGESKPQIHDSATQYRRLETPEERWERMRAWVATQIVPEAAE